MDDHGSEDDQDAKRVVKFSGTIHHYMTADMSKEQLNQDSLFASGHGNKGIVGASTPRTWHKHRVCQSEHLLKDHSSEHDRQHLEQVEFPIAANI
jgi:hypothetical protein